MVCKIMLKAWTKVRKLFHPKVPQTMPSLALTPPLNHSAKQLRSARDAKIKSVQHSLVFRDYKKTETCPFGVNLQAIYEAIITYFADFCFLWNQFSQMVSGTNLDKISGTNSAGKYHFSAANSSTLPAQKNACIILKPTCICEYWVL